ncbi:MAG TPA: proline dehydrogenase family protein, partial [Polyangiaceae bacterium]|nr:proline dehydrogenase family protein [Polyangiaceae bacterium]
MASPSSQLLALTLTDRALRSSRAAKSLAAVREVLTTTSSRGMPLLDRLGLRALGDLGPLVPTAAMRAVMDRLHKEAVPFVLDASEPALGLRLAERRARGFHINLNYLGEEVTSEAEAARRFELYLALAARDDIDALSVKLSALSSRLEPWAAPQLVPLLASRMEAILTALQRRDRLLYFDMEAHRDLEPTLQIVERLASVPSLLGARIGVALQAYLPDSVDAAERLLHLSRSRLEAGGVPIRVRLVKGANLAAESIESSLAGLPLPIFPEKRLVDANYKRLLLRLLSAARSGWIRLGLASHNLFDLSLGLLAAERSGTRSSLQLEMLEGMAGATGRVLCELHGPLLLYCPCVTPESFPAALSYLVRRLDENTSPENFLSNAVGMESGDERFVRERERFLEACRLARGPLPSSYRANVSRTPTDDARAEFRNASDTDFSQPGVQAELERALTGTRQTHFEVGPLLAEARDFAEPAERVELPGFDPSRPGVVPYQTRLAGPRTLRSALGQLADAAQLVAEVPAIERANWLERAAAELERERPWLISLLVLDAGKRVREADLEVSEAIDFARYYARSYQERADTFRLEPRGPTVVVPPWNFALAIPLGGCFAALMAGNPVLLKPAPETPLVAWAAVGICHRVGIPRAALQFVPCSDAHASALIEDPRVRVVALTGATSTARLFLRKRPDLHLLAETGGKNGLYVSALSDREQAVSIVLRSAFGHAGQKCSALGVLVLEDELMHDAS